MTALSQPATATPRGADEAELLADLTELERELVRTARRGSVLDCHGLPMGELAATDNPGRRIRAELIRELLLGRRGELDPRGVRVSGVRVTGELDLGHVHARAALEVTGSVFDKRCDLRHACLPRLVLRGSHLVELQADGLQVDGGVHLDHGFRVTSTVRLVGVHIRGDLVMAGAELTNGAGSASNVDSLVDHGPLVDLRRLTAGSLTLSPAVVCTGGATTTGPCPDTHRHIDLSNLTYGDLRGVDWRQWLHLLRHHSRAYAAQPYQQLAAIQRAGGQDGPARRILITQQDDLRRRGHIGGWRTRFMHWAWGKVAAYGYRTSRLVTALLLAVIAAGALGVLAGHVPIRDGRYVAGHTRNDEHPNTPCSLIEQIGLGIDRGLPLGATGLRQRCDLDTASRRGQAITIAVWAVQAVVWALATLALAGYTGLIRKID